MAAVDERSFFPASLQDEFSLVAIPDTACLANFRLCLWHEPGRAKSFTHKTFDYYFPAIYENEKGVKLFKVLALGEHSKAVWLAEKKRQRTAAVQDANAHTRAIKFAPAFWRFLQNWWSGGAAVDARCFFPSSFEDGFSLVAIPDTACLANFRLCLWHESRRAKSFTYDF